MASFKQVTLKDPVTGEYLSPRVYGALEYEVVEDGEVTPPYDTNADTLQGHPASDFLLKSEYTPVDAIPTGVICMWSGESTAIPSGWHLCDGEEGTPDLRDRFIVGAGSSYDVGDIGGSDSVTLSTSQIPSHMHSIGSHSHDVYLVNPNHGSSSGRYIGLYSGSTNPGAANSVDNNAARGQTETASGNTGSAGSGSSHENRPPYYALCFIMKL